MRDRVEVVDYTEHEWRCHLCPEAGREASWPETVAAAIRHLRDGHALPEKRAITMAIQPPRERSTISTSELAESDRILYEIDGSPLPTSDEIDDAVSRWHEGSGEGLSLHEYLGWSWEDYARWVQTPSFIPGPLRIWP